MKAFLFVLCILNLQKNLLAIPEEPVSVLTILDPSNGCEVDFNKLQSEIEAIKNLLQNGEKNLDIDIRGSMNGDTSNDISSDIENLKKLLTELSARSGSQDLVDLIKDNKKFVNEKIYALSLDIQELMNQFNAKNEEIDETNVKHETLFVQISTKVDQMIQNFNKEQLEINTFIENNSDSFKKLEEFAANITKLIDTKVEQQQNELNKLKTQNDQLLEQLKQFNERLTQQETHYKEHAENVIKNIVENQATLTIHSESWNKTLIEHFDNHAETLNGHDNSLKDIKEGIAKLDNEFGTECTKFDANKELVETLIGRFDRNEPLWQKLEILNETPKNCESAVITIDVQLEDENNSNN